MKRAANFNPVYPYEEQTNPNTALPPFFSSDGLEEQPGGKLALKITNPLGFDLDGHLKLKLGSGLRISDGNLEAEAQEVETQDPLQKQGSMITLATDSSLQVKNGRLAVNFPPKTTMTAQDPLAITDDLIRLRIGNGLSISDLKQLQVAIDPSLFFSNGILTVPHMTMWTGTSFTPNANFRSTNGQNNAQVDLILNKSGNLVNGMVRITGTGRPIIEVNGNSPPIVLTLQFLEDGTFNQALSELKGPFGFRVGNEVSNDVGYNPLLMMPSAHFYPRHPATPVNKNQLRVFDCDKVVVDPDLNTGWTFYYRVEYNVDVPATGFSIRITWFKFNNPADIGLKSSWCYFSYLTHK